MQLRQEKATFKQIADATGIHLATCRNIVDAFVLGKLNMLVGRSGRRPLPLPADVEHYLRHCLHEERYLSLRQRSRHILARFNFNMSHTRILKYFKRHKIQYRSTYYA